MNPPRKVLVSKRHQSILNDPNSSFNTDSFRSTEMALFFPDPNQAAPANLNSAIMDKNKMAQYALYNQWYHACNSAKNSKAAADADAAVAAGRLQADSMGNPQKSLKKKDAKKSKQKTVKICGNAI